MLGKPAPLRVRECPVVDSFEIWVDRKISGELFFELSQSVRDTAKGVSLEAWLPFSNMHESARDWFKRSIGNHVENGKMEMALIRTREPIDVMEIHQAISSAKTGEGTEEEKLSPVTPREAASFLLSKKLQMISADGPIIILTPSLLRDEGGYFLVVIGPKLSRYNPMRSIGIISARMAIPAGTTLLVRKTHKT